MSDRLQKMIERAGQEAETLRKMANRHEANGYPIWADMYRNEAWRIEQGHSWLDQNQSVSSK